MFLYFPFFSFVLLLIVLCLFNSAPEHKLVNTLICFAIYIPLILYYFFNLPIFYILEDSNYYLTFLPFLLNICTQFFLLYLVFFLLLRQQSPFHLIVPKLNSIFSFSFKQNLLFTLSLSLFLTIFPIIIFLLYPPSPFYSVNNNFSSFYEYLLLPFVLLISSRKSFSPPLSIISIFPLSSFIICIIPYGNRLQIVSFLLAYFYRFFILENRIKLISLTSFSYLSFLYSILSILSLYRDRVAINFSNFLFSLLGISFDSNFQSSNFSGSFFSSLQILSVLDYENLFGRFTDFLFGVFYKSSIINWSTTSNPYVYFRDILGFTSPGGGLLPVTSFFSGSFILITLVILIFLSAFNTSSYKSIFTTNFSCFSILVFSLLPRTIFYTPLLLFRFLFLLLFLRLIIYLLPSLSSSSSSN